MKLISVADNTNLFGAGEELYQLLELVMWEMKKIKIWCNINKLSLNLEKAKFMIFGQCKQKKQVINPSKDRSHRNKKSGWNKK